MNVLVVLTLEVVNIQCFSLHRHYAHLEILKASVSGGARLALLVPSPRLKRFNYCFVLKIVGHSLIQVTFTELTVRSHNSPLIYGIYIIHGVYIYAYMVSELNT